MTPPPSQALVKTQEADGKLELWKHFQSVRTLGQGGVGTVDLVQLIGSQHRFAVKTLDKTEMLERNKVQRRLTCTRTLQAPSHTHRPGPLCAGCRGLHPSLWPPLSLSLSLTLPAAAFATQVQRCLTEAHVLSTVDHPFLPVLYATLQTPSHLHFVMVRHGALHQAMCSCLGHPIASYACTHSFIHSVRYRSHR
jgi:serine/threonine protein kinase